MSVKRDDNGTVVLEGSCQVEEAESLLQLLQAAAASQVDWTRCTYLHTAVLQVILAARPAVVGRCGDTWVRQWVASAWI